MTIEDIMKLSNADLKKLSPKAQRELTSRLASAANKRLKRATQSNVTSKSITRASKRGGFSIKGKSDAEVRREFKTAKTFLESERSSVTGVKQANKTRMQKAMDTLKKNGVKITKKEFEKAITTYNRAKELNPKLGDKNLFDSSVIIGAIKKTGANQENIVDMIDDIEEEATRAMEEKEKEFEEIEELPFQ